MIPRLRTGEVYGAGEVRSVGNRPEEWVNLLNCSRSPIRTPIINARDNDEQLSVVGAWTHNTEMLRIMVGQANHRLMQSR